MEIWQKIGAFAAFLLPLFNIPMIVRILRRRSSADYSLVWALGVWSCCALMAPAGIASSDLAYRLLNIMNMIFFTAAAVCVVLFYKSKPRNPPS